ncbi:GNAT family N-acetyltransferase [Nocardioides sp. JQ2195]|uniref:GNAT family N-acetyltransferase n=1 Tax=Nocardioides sp. JQ2195 TaxID=2592334 RepID=UPI00143E7B38|nr:GNAT family protein [Nocardioides sp. JQ2195]QIX26121.1 GNAT family N-acetyltransferase [Nocardioides sp. JQ2195]
MTSRTNEHGQPIGPAVDDWVPCPFPDVTPMTGQWCRIEPIITEHADELYEELCGPGNDDLWTYLPREMPVDRAELAEHVEERSLATDSVTVVVRDAGGVAAGMASYLRIDQGNGSVEIGWIALGRRLQRTTAATEAQFLLARHVFSLGYRRYEWKCDALNEPSRRAAQRLGFTYEGRFRQAVVHKGRNRDTDWFSIVDSEWPALAAAYDAWLAPDNQVEGRQVRSLEEIRAGG